MTLTWWGDDPDGVVVGFIYTFDNNATDVQTWNTEQPTAGWTFTEETQETFVLTLTGSDTVYSLWVKAVDDDGAADTEGARQNFSVINSRPTVEFVDTSEVPDTTFTVATFIWTAFDLDGNDTIAKFEYVLDDTTDDTAWQDIDPRQTNITLTQQDGLTEGDHVFFLRATDVAGANGDIIRMPDEGETWYVREPASTVLLIDDYNVLDNTDAFLKTTIESLVGPVDVWDIKRNAGELEPPSVLAFTGTLLLFDTIVWYADTGPNLAKAQVSVPQFIDQGGKFLMTTTFGEFTTNEGDPVLFSPADSLGPRISRILRNQVVQATAEFSALGFPEMQVSASIIPNIYPLLPKASSKVMYVLPENPGTWPGTPPVGVIDRDDSFAFFTVPLASLNNMGTVALLLEKILIETF